MAPSHGPGNYVVLTLDNGENHEYQVPASFKFVVEGKPASFRAQARHEGLGHQIVEEPHTSSRQRWCTGTHPSRQVIFASSHALSARDIMCRRSLLVVPESRASPPHAGVRRHPSRHVHARSGGDRGPITPSTLSILPTHLYGMSCDIDPIIGIARAQFAGRRTVPIRSARNTWQMLARSGTRGFFSFHAFSRSTTYGGGLAWMRDAEIARRVEIPCAVPAASNPEIGKQHLHPPESSLSLFPMRYAASFTAAARSGACAASGRSNPTARCRYKRPLLERAGGDRPRRPDAPAEFICRTRAHARRLDSPRRRARSS